MEKLTTFTLHSGGALGADLAWDGVGNDFGLGTRKHYWHGSQTPLGNVEISDAELEEGWLHVLKANIVLKRQPLNYKSLLSRNWFQVKFSDAVFAISTLANPYSVNSGTGWAVQMAIDANKPCFVYDQELECWYRFIHLVKSFARCDAPVLTEQFAGIGTRHLNEAGTKEITETYSRTVCNLTLLKRTFKN